MSATQADVSAAIDKVAATAFAIKRQRDEFEAALRDIVFGADMMLQPSLNLTGSFLGYVKEVRRVAQEALNVRA